jgi:predicted deacylase
MEKNSLRIGSLEAKRGEKIFGFVDVRDNFGTICQLPVGIINGAEEGPPLLFTAGVHGCEYTGIEGVTRIYKETKPEGLKGTLIVITCMNLPAFRMRTPVVVPYDNKNLNRSFPGSGAGSAAEVIAHVVMKEFLPKVDFVVDCHSGDIGKRLFPIPVCNQTNDERINKKSKEMANAFGLDYCMIIDRRSGDDGSWVAQANKAGVPGIFAEIGYDGRYDESDIVIYVRGLKNVMKYLGMIPGKIERESNKAQTTYLESEIQIKTGSTGIFNPLVQLKERISRGQIVAEIRDLKGDVIEQIKSPEGGLLLMTMTKRIVNNGDTLFHILKLEE